MAYAEIEDVLARAGRLRGYFSETSEPSTTDVERWLDETSVSVDAILGKYGASTPVVGDAAELFRGIVADYVLILALTAAFPQGTDSSAGPTATAAADLVEETKARNLLAWSSLVDGTHPGMVVVVPDAGTLDASDFWSDNPDYDDRLQPGENWRLLPGVTRAMGL